MKRQDLVLIGVVLVIVVVFYVVRLLFPASDGGEVRVTIDGTEYSIINLSTDGVYCIEQDGAYNELHVKDGGAFMSEASCPDLLCTRQRHISKLTETIVCLPNRVMIEVISGEEREVDVIAQ